MYLRIMLLLHEKEQLAPGSGSLWLVSGILQLCCLLGGTHQGTGQRVALGSSSPVGKAQQCHSAPGSPGHLSGVLGTARQGTKVSEILANGDLGRTGAER